MQIKRSLILFLILIMQNCNTTEPPVKVEKNPREFVWSVDTLTYPGALQTLLKSMWGSSVDNIYAVGYCDDIKGQIWHYNGTQWSSLYIPMGLAYTPAVIYGFAANDIWIAGGYYAGSSTLDSAFVMHYDGGSWKRFVINGGEFIGAVSGISSDEVWFGGFNGTTIFHWDGNSFQKDSIPFYVPEYTQVLSIYSVSKDENYFLLYSATMQDHMYVFKQKQNNWNVTDSSVWGYIRDKIWVSDDGNIYETGSGGFFRWSGSSWNNLLGEVNGYTFGIKALGENNMFIVGWESSTEGQTKGLVYHYDGKDFYTFENLKLDDVTFMDVWWNGVEVFIVGYTHSYPQRTIILHGK